MSSKEGFRDLYAPGIRDGDGVGPDKPGRTDEDDSLGIMIRLLSVVEKLYWPLRGYCPGQKRSIFRTIMLAIRNS